MRVLLFGLIGFVPALVAPVVCVAQDVVLVGELKENLFPEAPSSGAAILGVQLNAQTQSAAFDLDLYYPDHDGMDDVCVTTVSAGGVYSAEGQFRRRSDAGRMLKVAYETREAHYVGALEADEFAVLARPGACRPIPFGAGESDRRPLDVVLSGWRLAQAGGIVDIFVNSLAADSAKAYPADDVFDGTVACEEIAVERATAYNLRCSLPLASLSTRPAAVKLDFYTSGELTGSSWLRIFAPAE